MTNEEFIEELETVDTEMHKIKRYDRNSSSDLRDIALKINEIVDVVNAIIDVFNLDVTVDVDCADIENVKLLKAMWEAKGNGTE